MAAEARFSIKAVDDTRQAFASVQNNLARLQNTANVAGRQLARSLDIRRAMTSVATAIGLNINAIADKVARLVSGTSAEQEKLQTEGLSLQSKLGDIQAKNFEDRLSDEQILMKLEQDREKFASRIKVNSGAAFGTQAYNDALQNQIDLEETIARITAQKIKVTEKLTADQLAYRKSTDALAQAQSAIYSGEALSLGERIASLRAKEGAIMYKMAGIGLEETEKRIALNYELAAVLEQITPLLEEQSRVARQAGEMIAFGFEDAIFSGEKLSTVLKQLGLDLVRLVFQNVVTAPLASGIGNVISGALSGFRADGGPVGSGKSYVVGERGPELFVPGSSGSIVPNDAMRSGGGNGGPSININYNISAGVSRAELAPILDAERRRLKAEIPDMVRRGGAYRAAFA